MKKILNKSKLIGSLVALVAAGTVVAAMSEHVGNVGANDEAYSQQKLSSHKSVNLLANLVKRMIFMHLL